MLGKTEKAREREIARERREMERKRRFVRRGLGFFFSFEAGLSSGDKLRCFHFQHHFALA